ncbi:GGDEF domain-containing protein [Maricaulis sp. CAU 1757]
MNGRLFGKEGRELAHKALGFMEQFDIAPTPENYAVWSCFAAETNPELCDSLRGLIETGAEFTETVNADLFEQYFQWKAVHDAIMDSGGAMCRQLGAVKETLEAAERDTAAYGEALSGASTTLRSAPDADGMKSLVESLVSATARMQKRSQDLEERLQQTSNEVTQLRSNLEKVREEAMTDALTGIANRKRFDESLRRARRDAENTGKPLSLVLCDIDHFKRFNDTWGHQTGDQIIRFVAGCLTRHAADDHLVARYGGEEFGIVMPNTDVMTAEQISEKIRRTVQSKKLLRKSTNEDLGNITLSLGVAVFDGRESVEELIERSDSYLYKSKTEGRNRTTGDGKAKQRNAA